jgi:hypothetical protein
MALTFNQLYTDTQEEAQDDSAATLTLIKRAINQGMQKFGAALNREWRNQRSTFSLVADQQYYQMPEDCIRPKTVVATIGDVDYPLTEEPDDDTWHLLNANSSSERSSIPERFKVEGSDLIGIWPVPSDNVSDAVTLRYESRMRKMTQADYTTGSITVANGSAAIVGSGTTFTEAMVGRTLFVEDGGDQDGIAYKIDAFIDATHVTLENYYAGSDGSGKSYRIGIIPDIPEEFHESLIDYALYRVYKRRKDRSLYRDCYVAFNQALEECRENYASSTSSTYTKARRGPSAGYVHSQRDYHVT